MSIMKETYPKVTEDDFLKGYKACKDPKGEDCYNCPYMKYSYCRMALLKDIFYYVSNERMEGALK